MLDRGMTAADAERLVEAELVKFLTLLKGSTELAEAVNKLEAQPYWHAVLASVEDNDDYTAGVEEESPNLREAVKRDLEDIRSKSQVAATRLDSNFRLSRMPRGLFRLAWRSQHLFKDIPLDSSGVPRSDESLGADALKRLQQADGLADEVKWIIDGIRLRFDVARYLLSEREFAKLDALEYKWPEAASILTSGPKVSRA